jgi:hypothetical protein
VAASGQFQMATNTDVHVSLVALAGRYGAQLLATTGALHPHAKRALLVGWNENRSARQEIIQLLAHNHQWS